MPDGDYAGFIARYTGRDCPAGDFVDESGHVLGQHKGIVHYTVGQRKGLGLGGGPWFVIKKDVEKNILYVSHGYDPETAYKQEFKIHDFHFLTAGFDKDETDVTFKIRHTPDYHHATIRQCGDGCYMVYSAEKIHGVAPGQFCVVYDHEHHRCYGSGEITL